MTQLVRFAKTEDEFAGLIETCRVWEFWSFEQVVDLLELKNYELYYLLDESNGATREGRQTWLGVCFYQVNFEFADLLYCYVFPSQRRLGYGAKVLGGSVDALFSETTIKKIFLEVRPSNLAAIKLYEQLGFKKQQLRKRYYSDGEDALVFEKRK